MTPRDLAALHARCFTLPRPWSETEIADLLVSPHVWAEVAPGGFALGRAIAGEAELLTIAVAPEARRTGTGRMLLARYEASARRRDASESFLEVAADNSAACALYRGAGYVQAGLRRDYYTAPGHVPVDAIVMRKSLKDD